MENGVSSLRKTCHLCHNENYPGKSALLKPYKAFDQNSSRRRVDDEQTTSRRRVDDEQSMSSSEEQIFVQATCLHANLSQTILYSFYLDGCEYQLPINGRLRENCLFFLMKKEELRQHKPT